MRQDTVTEGVVAGMLISNSPPLEPGPPPVVEAASMHNALVRCELFWNL
jgi:hypothetical protein